MKEVVLLGDSIFDNAVYVGGGPDVCQQVSERLPEGWKATLLAIDGSHAGARFTLDFRTRRDDFNDLEQLARHAKHGVPRAQRLLSISSNGTGAVPLM